MKKLNSFQIAFAFSGSFVGAGLVSGQELYQFFGVFGWYGIIGCILTTLALSAIGYMAMSIAARQNQEHFDYVIAGDNNEKFRKAISYIVIILTFGVMVIMIAGGGTLLYEKTGLPLWAGNLASVVLVAIAAYFGIYGLVKVFETLMPVLILAAIGICAVTLFTVETVPITANAFYGGNILLGNWVSSAVTYISYNILAAIIIFVPIATKVQDIPTLRKGTVMGGAVLLVIFLSMIVGICAHEPLIADSEMPMLTLAGKMGGVINVVYAVLLYFGVFASTLSAVHAMRIKMKEPAQLSKNVKMIIILLAAYILSLVGFKNLVSTVFPVCGYIGLVLLGGIIVNYYKSRKKVNG